METEAWVMVMSKSILKMAGQGVGEWIRWAVMNGGGACSQIYWTGHRN